MAKLAGLLKEQAVDEWVDEEEQETSIEANLGIEQGGRCRRCEKPIDKAGFCERCEREMDELEREEQLDESADLFDDEKESDNELCPTCKHAECDQNRWFSVCRECPEGSVCHPEEVRDESFGMNESADLFDNEEEDQDSEKDISVYDALNSDDVDEQDNERFETDNMDMGLDEVSHPPSSKRFGGLDSHPELSPDEYGECPACGEVIKTDSPEWKAHWRGHKAKAENKSFVGKMDEQLSPEEIDVQEDDRENYKNALSGHDLPRNQREVDILGSVFSDTYKELHGVRPRHVNIGNMSAEELQDRIDDLRQQLEDNYMVDYEDEERGNPFRGNVGESPIKFESLRRIIRSVIKETTESRLHKGQTWIKKTNKGTCK